MNPIFMEEIIWEEEQQMIIQGEQKEKEQQENKVMDMKGGLQLR